MPEAAERTYVIAVKREHRADVPGDWIETVRGIKGLIVREPATSKRIVVTGPRHAVAMACAKLSNFVYAEELIQHDIA